MFDPSRIVFHSRLLKIMITRYEGTDRHGPAPLREVLNLRRYEVTWRPGTSKHKTLIASPHKPSWP